jgi:tetratricopeptide (TPR) repeat protein
VDEAIAELRKAVDLNPNSDVAHATLSSVLIRKQRWDEVMAEARAAIRLKDSALARLCLGDALSGKGRWDEAMVEFRRAIELKPGFQHFAYAHCRLGYALNAKGRLDEAVAAFRKAFASDPRLANDLSNGNRYNAACYAALAAAGRGAHAAKLDDKERARLRKQALNWLRADLARRTKQLESGRPAARAQARRSLRHWQQDRDLAGIRGPAALAKLPAEEQAAFAKLWADVAAALKKAEDQPK